MPSATFISTALPDSHGIGLEQRAYTNFRALKSIFPVHFIFVSNTRSIDRTKIADFIERAQSDNFLESFSVILTEHQDCRDSGIGSLLTASLRDLLQFRYTRVVRLETIMGKAPVDMSNIFCFRITSFSALCSSYPAEVIRNANLVTDIDDLEWKLELRHARATFRQAGIEATLSRFIKAINANITEHAALRMSKAAFVCSELDRSSFNEKTSQKIYTVPNSVSVNSVGYTRATGLCGSRRNFLFLGALSYPPNVDAVRWLASHVVPACKAQNFSPSIELVGRRPSQSVIDISRKMRWALHADVEDVGEFFGTCTALLVPIRFSGGTRIKILEALLYGRPVITTSLGAEGLQDLGEDQGVILADSAESFAFAISRVAEENEYWSERALKGRDIVVKRYSRDAAIDHISSILSSVFIK
jgi:hypothetical protein